jgi:hypothetical protein
MADKKISVLNAATTIFDADDFAVVQDGETKQTNASVVKTYVKDGLSKSDVGLGNVDNTSDATKNAATATLTNKTISGSSNTLSDIGNTSLTNSAITFGATSQALGSTVSALNAVSIGGTTAAAGAFTTLSASSTVSGTGFSNYLASPPAIGGTTPAAGAFTTLSASSTVSGTGFSTYLASPPAIGGSSPAAGSFTTLTTSSTVTLNGGTANGVGYLNASKVLTTGTALTFDGTTFKATTNAGGVSAFFTDSTYSTLKISHADTSGNIAFLNGANQNYAVFGSSSIFYTSGTEQMRLTSTGLGIGTSPSVKLHISGSGDQYARVATTNVSRAGLQLSANGTLRSVLLYDDNAGTTFLSTASALGGTGQPLAIESGSSITLATAGSTRATLDASGNLGLGVTPSAWAASGTNFKACEVGYAGNSFAGQNGASQVSVSSNCYFNSGWKYANTSVAAAQYYQQAGQHIWQTAASGTAGGTISFTQAMTLTAAGVLLTGGKTSTTANGGDVQVSRGVTFPATQVACSDANTLDDYEEGAWTPVVAGSGTPGTFTYSNRTGIYTKIGRVVQVNADIFMSGYSVAGSGDLTITGLPFTAVNQNQNGNIAYHAGISLTKDYTIAGIIGNTTTVLFLDLGQDGTQTVVQASAVPNANSYIRFNLTYIV